MTNNERDDLAAWFHMEFDQGSGCIHLTNYRSQCETWADQFLLTGKGLLDTDDWQAECLRWRDEAEAGNYDELIAERDRLRRWKAEAMEIMDGLHDLGRALGLPLGTKVTGLMAIATAEGLKAKADSEQRAARQAEARAQAAESALAAVREVRDHYASPTAFPADGLVPVASVVSRLDAALATPTTPDTTTEGDR